MADNDYDYAKLSPKSEKLTFLNPKTIPETLETALKKDQTESCLMCSS